jgi:creatinine amidohydrolase
MAFRRWQDLSSRAFAALDPARAVAVLPLAATEQHGPHLAAGTDFWIAEGLLAEAARLCPAELDVLGLPTLRSARRSSIPVSKGR